MPCVIRELESGSDSLRERSNEINSKKQGYFRGLNSLNVILRILIFFSIQKLPFLCIFSIKSRTPSSQISLRFLGALSMC